MQIEQFVMAYGVEQDRLRALLPEGFASRAPYCASTPRFAAGKAPISNSTRQFSQAMCAAG